MKMKTEKLLDDLVTRTHKILDEVTDLAERSREELNEKPSDEAWSALECIEHLNRFGDFYLPEIDQAMKKSTSEVDPVYKSGLFGNYFANTMKPGDGMTKMGTFKDKDPSGSQLDKSVLDRFKEQQQRLLKQLDRARSVNINKTRIPLSITRWIRLKLGDTFRVLIYHNERHLQQARRTLKQIQAK
jgi:hypothetical protein